MDEILSRGIDGNISADSVLSTIETPSQRKERYTQLVCKVVFLVSVFVFGLSLFFAIFVDLQLWISSIKACAALVISAGFCWWLSNTNRIVLAGRIIVLTVTLIVSVTYWLTPYFALYLIFLFLVTIVQIVWGIVEAICVGGLLLINSLLYLILNHNHMIAPDGQVITVDFGTFIIWWSLIISTGWLVSFLYNTVQRDNLILNLQTTELKGSQQQLRDSKERYRALSQASFEGIVLHEQGKVLEANQTLAEMLGYAFTELAGKALVGLIKPLQETTSVLSGDSDCPVEAWGIRKDGSLFSIECQSRNFVFRGRTVKVCAIRDITVRKQTEEALKHSQQQLLQAQKMESIGRLAGGIAHDFNNLLTVILGESNLLLSEIDPQNEDYASLQDIRFAAERASSLTQQLLAFSRQQVLEPRVVDLNTIVTGMEHLLRRLIRDNIQLDIQLESELSEVKIDPGQFEQVVMNLALNARDAMPKGGKLTIKTTKIVLNDESFLNIPNLNLKKGDYTILEVVDNGVGMDSIVQAHIFEPFYTTKEVGKGTGLGLATTFGIVKQSGGYIVVDSTPGHGTTFRIYLPIIPNFPVKMP